MIATINLLPWREEYRQEKRIEFFKIAAVVFAGAALTLFVWSSFVNGAIENQEARNQRLEQEIAALEVKVQEIAELKEIKEGNQVSLTAMEVPEVTDPG